MDIYVQFSLIIIIFLACSIYRFGTGKLNNTICLNQLIDPQIISVIYTVKEMKVRKEWLISLFIYSFFWAICNFLWYTDQYLVGLSKSYDFLLSVLLIIISSIIVVIPSFLIVYHCAYRKPGTKWLIWTMIMIPLKTLASLGEYTQATGKIWVGLFIMMLGIQIFYWINCRNLYRINLYQQMKTLKNEI